MQTQKLLILIEESVTSILGPALQRVAQEHRYLKSVEKQLGTTEQNVKDLQTSIAVMKESMREMMFSRNQWEEFRQGFAELRT